MSKEEILEKLNNISGVIWVNESQICLDDVFLLDDLERICTLMRELAEIHGSAAESGN